MKSAIFDKNKSQIPVNIDLQLNLLNTWTKFKVADYYQNIFLAHIDQLPTSLVQQKIKKQISLTIQRSSPYFQLQRLQKQRQDILKQIRLKLAQITQIRTNEQLQQILQLLSELRQTNLLTAQQIFKIYSTFNCQNIKIKDKLMQHFDDLFQKLDKDNNFIKMSLLNQYIYFDQGYDPFIMTQYENYHRQRSQNINPAIKKYYTLNISYAYRLMKTRNMILQLKSLVKKPDHQQVNKNMYQQTYVNKFKDQVGRKKSYDLPIVNDNSIDPYRYHVKRASAQKINKNTPKLVKLQPIHIFPPRARSKTTFDEDRPESSSITQKPFKSRPKMNSISPLLQDENTNYNKKPYFINQSNKYNDEIVDTPRSKKQMKYNTKIGELYRPMKLSDMIAKQKKLQQQNMSSPLYKNLSNRSQNQFQRQNSNRKMILPISTIDQNKYQNYQQKTVNYNPILKQKYAKQFKSPQQPKYSFNPNLAEKGIIRKNTNLRIKTQPEQEEGLIPQKPILKFNIRPKNSFNNIPRQNYTVQNNIDKNKEAKQNKPTVVKVNQQCQTMDFSQSNKKPQKQSLKQNTKERQQTSPIKKLSPPKIVQPESQESDQQSSQQQIPKKTVNKKNSNDNNQVLQQQNIIDQRYPKSSTKNSNQPLIRPVNQQISKPASLQTPKKQSQSPKNNQQSNINSPARQRQQSPNNKRQSSPRQQKRQVKMKIGKSSLPQVLNLLQKEKISQQTKNTFNIQKLIQWIKTNQTYLIQFNINDNLGIIALCSPISNIGMALKLWAPVHSAVDQNLSKNLFKKYIQYIQKTTTCKKIMFVGPKLQQLDYAQFKLQKQNYYVRVRKNQSTLQESQFKPFLYIECSNVYFVQKKQQKSLYSQQIQQFSTNNYWCQSFIAQCDRNSIPQQIKSIVKYNQNLEDFNVVNQILSKQKFDNYEASQVKASKIKLLRIYLSSIFKSPFVAQDGYFKLIGNIVRNQSKELIISMPIASMNGMIYFCKGIFVQSVRQKINTEKKEKTSFGVMMFSKKLYGKMVNFKPGCYGNWEINLTWEDEMQGRVRHTSKQPFTFGPQPFLVAIQLEQIIVYVIEIKKQDNIL